MSCSLTQFAPNGGTLNVLSWAIGIFFAYTCYDNANRNSVERFLGILCGPVSTWVKVPLSGQGFGHGRPGIHSAE